MLDDGTRRAEPSVGLQRNRRHAAPAVVGNHERAPVAIHGKVTGAGTAAGLFIPERQFSGGSVEINCKSFKLPRDLSNSNTDIVQSSSLTA